MLSLHKSEAQQLGTKVKCKLSDLRSCTPSLSAVCIFLLLRQTIGHDMVHQDMIAGLWWQSINVLE